MTQDGPSAALYVDWSGSVKSDPVNTVYFFKQKDYIRWDVDHETLFAEYPQKIEDGWPGLLDAFPGEPLTGAIHVPAWRNKIYFFFRNQSHAVLWDVASHTCDPDPKPISEIMPSHLTEGTFFAPLYVDNGHVQKVYAFRGDTYTRWTVEGSRYPTTEDEGYPRKIGDGWTKGLTVSPNCAVNVYWRQRPDEAERRKIYFFLGDLYIRWDVETHTKNYELDISSGWKGWPDFE